jgi:UDP-N-acetylmuramoyl-tripeptide--D-alanyl-D-alanine ligase
VDGGEYAGRALQAGAWGVLVAPEHARAAARMSGGAAVLSHPDPLAGLQALARAWRTELRAAGTKVVAITGSTGKTSTKDILAAILSGSSPAPRGAGERNGLAARSAGALRTFGSPANFNTEIGLPLALLAAPRETEALVLELAMRGAGQIAELAEIAQPEVAVIVNVGPAHLELLGSLEAVAAAKAELIAGLAAGATAVIPVDEPLLARHLRADVRTVTFGDGGDVALLEARADGRLVIARGSETISLHPSFGAAHQLRNLLAAVAAAGALGVSREGRLEVRFSASRGERLALPGGVVLIDDCYNANPMSMRAAIDDLAATATGRRVAVLGDMLELGSRARDFHREIGGYASAQGVDLLVTVGPLASEMLATFAGEAHSVPDAPAAVELLQRLIKDGDTVLVKASRGVGLERVAQALGAEPERIGEHPADAGGPRPYARPGRR